MILQHSITFFNQIWRQENNPARFCLPILVFGASTGFSGAVQNEARTICGLRNTQQYINHCRYLPWQKQSCAEMHTFSLTVRAAVTDRQPGPLSLSLKLLIACQLWAADDRCSLWHLLFPHVSAILPGDLNANKCFWIFCPCIFRSRIWEAFWGA